MNPHTSGTAAWLIFELQAVPPETQVNVPTAYGGSPSPVAQLIRQDEVEGVILDNGCG